MAYLVETKDVNGDPVRVLIGDTGERLTISNHHLPIVRELIPFEDDEIPGPRFLDALDWWKYEQGMCHERYEPRSPLWLDRDSSGE
jgi:hypothetical protein